MNNYDVFLDEMFCRCHEMKLSRLNDRDHYCIICGGDLKKEDRIVLLINNYKLFPNCISHIDCLPDGKINEEVLRKLKNDYSNIKEQYDFIKEKAKKWGLGE